MSEEKQQKMDVFEKQILQSFLMRIQDRVEDIRDIIRDLAKRLESENLIPKFMISGTIKKWLRDAKIGVHDRIIEEALDKEYKEQRGRKIAVEESTSNLPEDNGTKLIEQTTNGSQYIESKSELDPLRQEENMPQSSISDPPSQQFKLESAQQHIGMLQSEINQRDEMIQKLQDEIKNKPKEAETVKPESKSIEIIITSRDFLALYNNRKKLLQKAQMAGDEKRAKAFEDCDFIITYNTATDKVLKLEIAY